MGEGVGEGRVHGSNLGILSRAEPSFSCYIGSIGPLIGSIDFIPEDSNSQSMG